MAKADCPECSGTGWRVVENPGTNGMAQRFAAGDGARAGSATGEPKTVWAVPCECTDAERHSRVFERARLPKRYSHCNFDNYNTNQYNRERHGTEAPAWNESLAAAKLVTQGFVRDFPVSTEHGLMLMGPCGVGKTHLAVAALAEIIRRGHGGLFYDYRELLKEIQNSYNPESNSTEMGVLEPVLKTEVLLLDDLGSSKPSLWALDTVGHILNTRYNETRPTIITTNFLDSPRSRLTEINKPAELSQTSVLNSPPDSALYGAPPLRDESLTDRIGVRIRSRLYEMCRTVEVCAGDYRKGTLVW